MDMNAGFAGALAGVTMALGALAGYSLYQYEIQMQAIERGYALYCPANGEWAWKGECETQPEES